MSASDLIANLEKLGDEFLQLIQPLGDEQTIRAAQAQFLGKKGKVSEVMRELSKLAPADRPLVGAAVNKVKQTIEERVTERLGELASAAARADLARVVDVTLPPHPAPAGHLHLLTQVRLEAVQIFSELGFVVADGPQIETDWHTFEALAIPKEHPARDMQDTFYVSDEIVLRTHTSPVQVRTMQLTPPPIRIVAPGVVYRRDDDPTHSPMFTQIEGLAVDVDISFADLKGVLLHFVKRFFARDLAIRLRPSYFPFVEPGAEVDMQCSFCMGAAPAVASCRVCKGTGFVEIGGCGMVDPEVFAHVKIDAEKYTGFAFGMGLERMAMLRHGVNDIKFYYEGDVRFLEQF
ncbi:MAG: phenylalanine--tRNA ligase subunit alpha [Deltaproteobacteria bacterium]|nr:phenylalanine--tRNA ligase subunit alpha [Deltaproteobacteria bacterium]MCW5808987.1 phenylalanine--tRNA ligase subunit alpha [Deltaproteobacteria bacterium]